MKKAEEILRFAVTSKDEIIQIDNVLDLVEALKHCTIGGFPEVRFRTKMDTIWTLKINVRALYKLIEFAEKGEELERKEGFAELQKIMGVK